MRAGLVAAVALATGLVTAPAFQPGAAERSLRELMRFAAEMAKEGNWREASFRWEQASGREPENARILNNLAVAREALGDFDGASELYDKALLLSKGDPRIAENAGRHRRFKKTLEEEESRSVEDRDRAPVSTSRRETGKKGRKTIKVPVRLPLPPRVDLTGMSTILVASFQTDESNLLDTNREMVRYLRSELRKRSRLQVLDVTPAPAIPEQSLEDLIANAAFWQHLGREYGPDLILTGIIRFDRNDASGFQEVDVIDSVTGHKVRRNRFVEQEEFVYELVTLFFDAKTGELLHQDRATRAALFRGQVNDPLTAFFELSGQIAGDIMSAVTPRHRVDMRFIFQG